MNVLKMFFKVRTLSFAFTFIYRYQWAALDAVWSLAVHQDGQTPIAIVNGCISFGKTWHNGAIVSEKVTEIFWDINVKDAIVIFHG